MNPLPQKRPVGLNKLLDSMLDNYKDCMPPHLELKDHSFIQSRGILLARQPRWPHRLLHNDPYRYDCRLVVKPQISWQPQAVTDRWSDYLKKGGE